MTLRAMNWACCEIHGEQLHHYSVCVSCAAARKPVFVGTEPYLVRKRARKAADRARYNRFKKRASLMAQMKAASARE